MHNSRASRRGIADARLASWEFADFVFGKEWDLLTDTGRLRRAG